jgi:hypothetical protein
MQVEDSLVGHTPQLGDRSGLVRQIDSRSESGYASQTESVVRRSRQVRLAGQMRSGPRPRTVR